MTSDFSISAKYLLLAFTYLFFLVLTINVQKPIRMYKTVDVVLGEIKYAIIGTPTTVQTPMRQMIAFDTFPIPSRARLKVIQGC